ncbi:MAG: CinA family protein [Clostridia bacterium]|nr:CinA family protein [Clostridia bacterium]
MTNVCILLKERQDYLSDTGYAAVVDAFLRGGYTFEEILILNLEKERSIFDAVKGYKQACDNVVVVVPKAWLQSVRLLLGEIYPADSLQGVSAGAGVYVDGDKSLFLLSADDKADGKAYVVATCIPYLQKKYDTRTERMTLRLVGAAASTVFDLIEKSKAMGGAALTCTHSRRLDEDVVEIFYDQTAPKVLMDDVLRLFAENLAENIYAYEDVTLEEQLVRLLQLRGKKISVAESFTGGGIAKRITSVSGASSVYFEGINCYHEGSKMMRLGVDDRTLMQKGAVSEETAYEMAAGLLSTSCCDICLATTGLAGPLSDSSGLPVGLCFLAVGTRDRVHVMRYKFDGDREEVTQKAINYALFSAYKTLKEI